MVISLTDIIRHRYSFPKYMYMCYNHMFYIRQLSN